MDGDAMTEEQRQRAESNRLAALAKRKTLEGATTTRPTTTAASNSNQDVWKLFKCKKVNLQQCVTSSRTNDASSCNDQFQKPPQVPVPVDKFKARLEICSPDSFSITPAPLKGISYPGEAVCLERLRECLANVLLSHYTQLHGGGKACVYKLVEYDAVLRCLKSFKGIEIEEIPWGTFNVVERLSHTFVDGGWIPSRPEHFCDEKVDELLKNLPRKLLDSLLPFQLEGLRFGLRRGARCLIADEMGLGKTLQAIAIAACFMNEGPVLVVCPAILRLSWAEELERWLPFCSPSDIHLVFGRQNDPTRLERCPRVVVISYTMLHHLLSNILKLQWAFLIVDESHYVRSSKKLRETHEVKAVLDVSARINRIVLLSGTPSLSRPYDIFQQINMLWPGLLGKDKYEFAKTYCSAKLVQRGKGKMFKDFSNGVRLEELNVLLKQTVMIRRLKQHVLMQLPPKRRQLINLKLKNSDIVSAIEMVKNDKSSTDAAEGIPSEVSEDVDDGGGCCEYLKTLSKQVIGIAKLSGFRDWLCMHPTFAGSDDADMETNHSCQKMIIFGHHHKVLDGVQELVCEKGIGFIRIDGTTLPRDRQSAVHLFQSSREVKIAIIGIMAASFGIDLSSAENVVFLELPLSPSIMLQAEDRAHRRGQTKAVNIYIFCANDTSDLACWRSLNKSLNRVSSTVDGKYSSVRGIEVDRVTSIGISGETDGNSRNPNFKESRSIGTSGIESMVSSKSISDFNLCTDLDKTINEGSEVENTTEGQNVKDCSSSHDDLFHNEGKQAIMISNHNGTLKSVQTEEGNESIEKDLKDSGNSLKAENLRHDECCAVMDVDSNIRIPTESLRFEVSQYTRRIHIYTCHRGTDSRPKPLFESFCPEDLEVPPPPASNNKEKAIYKCIKDNPAYRSILSAFVKEWNNLTPIQRNKLLAKPLQLPLSFELYYLKEHQNHNSEGLLKVGSNRRTTPLDEINSGLPLNAVWKKVHLRSGHGKREKEYNQGWSVMDEPLCKFCQSPCQSEHAKTPEYFEDLFCKLACHEEYRMRTSNNFLRRELFQIEKGVCTFCQLNCHKLVKDIRPLSLENRLKYIMKVAPKLSEHKKLLDKLVHHPTEGNAWHADHTIAVYLGGGECNLENMRTLCVACHAEVTSAQCADRRTRKALAKKQIKAVMDNLKKGDGKRTDSISERQEKTIDDHLLVMVPGSAYSITTKNDDATIPLRKMMAPEMFAYFPAPPNKEDKSGDEDAVSLH
ncbi:DNA annealing helicase and endonuclease ZRANB3-like isoform X1 [Impatiens glandulifera]|uniref:DNA annealing helicase and endonuclease ZRANB3-like isoform X1 n=1 Tax=Impatiens glandulifera TaxID=253017 RepID=UPI001FB17444|nr:DNA annealing helicase and endonuclease ZRANB3-like isoform X1 [Impatiens glandulifera]